MICESLAKSHRIKMIKFGKRCWKSHGSLALACCLQKECWFGIFCVLFALGFRLPFFVTPAIHLPKPMYRSDVPNVPPWALQELQEQLKWMIPVLHQKIYCWMLPADGPESSAVPEELTQLSAAGWWMVPSPVDPSHSWVIQSVGMAPELLRGERLWFKDCVQKGNKRREVELK